MAGPIEYALPKFVIIPNLIAPVQRYCRTYKGGSQKGERAPAPPVGKKLVWWPYQLLKKFRNMSICLDNMLKAKLSCFAWYASKEKPGCSGVTRVFGPAAEEMKCAPPQSRDVDVGITPTVRFSVKGTLWRPALSFFCKVSDNLEIYCKTAPHQYLNVHLVYTHSQKSQLTLEVNPTAFHASKLVTNTGEVNSEFRFLCSAVLSRLTWFGSLTPADILKSTSVY